MRRSVPGIPARNAVRGDVNRSYAVVQIRSGAYGRQSVTRCSVYAEIYIRNAPHRRGRQGTLVSGVSGIIDRRRNIDLGVSHLPIRSARPSDGAHTFSIYAITEVPINYRRWRPRLRTY